MVYPVPSNDTMAEDMNSLQEHLRESASCKSAICAINTNMAAVELHGAVALRVPRHYTPLPTLEALALEILSDRWADTYTPVRGVMDQMQSPLSITWEPAFPSQRVAASKTLDGKLNLEFKWMRQGTALQGDWSLYISEPFAKRPQMDMVVRVVDVTPVGTNSRRIALLASSSQSLESVRRQYDASIQDIGTAILLEFQIETLLCAVLEAIKTDTTEFLRSTTERVNDVVRRSRSTAYHAFADCSSNQDIASRRDPSASKVQYLLHLKECHLLCAEACRGNAAAARRISRDIELPACLYLYAVRDELHALALDLEYLAETIDRSVVRIDEVMRLSIDQIEIFDKRRNRIIGTLIAAYVPLAFTTVSTSAPSKKIRS